MGQKIVAVILLVEIKSTCRSLFSNSTKYLTPRRYRPEAVRHSMDTPYHTAGSLKKVPDAKKKLVVVGDGMNRRFSSKQAHLATIKGAAEKRAY
jgi:hypothetical protein